ncbi:MAG: hypothetical protein GTN74_00560 [Proteobacteria bacterium]|nr:hypothetical protein [Pseudomonadota bacterium]NIS67505.1 hypothetical protein [Pseudomonadota bacterium]
MEFPEFSKQEVCNLLILNDNFEYLYRTLISLHTLALALTLAGLADFAVAGQRKKAKGLRRETPNKPLSFNLSGSPNASAKVLQGHDHPQSSVNCTEMLRISPFEKLEVPKEICSL